MEVVCQYRKCRKTFVYNENTAGRPPEFCCEKHRKAERRAERKEKKETARCVSHTSILYRRWAYHKGHKFLRDEKTDRTCVRCGLSWISRDAVDFECPQRPLYTLANKPEYLIDYQFLKDRGFLPVRGKPFPYPAAFLLLDCTGLANCRYPLYDLREITPMWSELLGNGSEGYL